MRKTWMISIFVILLIIGLIVGIFYIMRAMKAAPEVRQELAQLNIKDNAGINQNSESESEVNNPWKSEVVPRLSDERKNNSRLNLEKNRARRKENAKEDNGPGDDNQSPGYENEDSNNNIKNGNEFEDEGNNDKGAESNNGDKFANLSKESREHKDEPEADSDIKKAMADNILDELGDD